MVLPVKFSEGIQEHIEAGHFTIYAKPWMGDKRIWIWTKGQTDIVGGAVATRAEAETAAVAWYESQPK